jgi:hypothetical protein
MKVAVLTKRQNEMHIQNGVKTEENIVCPQTDYENLDTHTAQWYA